MTLIKTNFPTWSSLSDFIDDNLMQSKFINGDWNPATNVINNIDNYEVEIAVPGLKKEDFNVKIENGTLIVKGDSQKEEEEDTKNYTRKEFSSSSFSSYFALPDTIEDKDIVAKYEDGILHITLSKTPKKIHIKKEVTVH